MTINNVLNTTTMNNVTTTTNNNNPVSTTPTYKNVPTTTTNLMLLLQHILLKLMLWLVLLQLLIMLRLLLSIMLWLQLILLLIIMLYLLLLLHKERAIPIIITTFGIFPKNFTGRLIVVFIDFCLKLKLSILIFWPNLEKFLVMIIQEIELFLNSDLNRSTLYIDCFLRVIFMPIWF